MNGLKKCPDKLGSKCLFAFQKHVFNNKTTTSKNCRRQASSLKYLFVLCIKIVSCIANNRRPPSGDTKAYFPTVLHKGFRGGGGESRPSLLTFSSSKVARDWGHGEGNFHHIPPSFSPSPWGLVLASLLTRT